VGVRVYEQMLQLYLDKRRQKKEPKRWVRNHAGILQTENIGKELGPDCKISKKKLDYTTNLEKLDHSQFMRAILGIRTEKMGNCKIF
jgi:hypothetical protein